MELVGDEAAVSGLVLDSRLESGFRAVQGLSPEVANLLALYLPLCLGAYAQELTLGHLGQSLDGQIATAEGASRFITGPEDVLHTHRLRALCDAVIVGAGTAQADDPQLTTRLAPGKNPLRVVLDPALRLPKTLSLFSDDMAPTLVICTEAARNGQKSQGQAEVLGLDAPAGNLSPQAIVQALHERGFLRLLIEGGGNTLSRFVAARALHRLHLAVSAVFLGSGRPGLVLPGVHDLRAAERPTTRRLELGQDVLFDCDFTRPS